MTPNEVCHYTKKDTALEKILSGRKIKFGLLGLTNDPKETKLTQMRLVSIGTPFYDQTYEAQVLTESERILKEEWKVLCTTQHLPIKKNQDSIKNEVLSKFRHGYNRPRMWAQYAENHSGVCLIFNGKKLHENIRSSLSKESKLFCGVVNYKNYGSIASKPLPRNNLLLNKSKLSDTLREHYLKYYEHYFLSKYPDWQNETEYRWLVHNTSNAPEFVDITGALKTVIVGSDFPTVYEPAIIAVCKKLKVDVGKMEWRNGLPEPSLSSLYNSKD